MQNQNLIQIGFFYKGHGLLINQKMMDPKKFITIGDKAIKNYGPDIQKDGTGWIYDQLDAIIGQDQIDRQDYDIFCLNVYVLTTLGHLKNDNDNGLLFTYDRK